MTATTPPIPLARSGATALAVARECSASAGSILRAAYGSAEVRSVKGPRNVVTETDFAVERAVMAFLSREYPDIPVLSEESTSETRSDGWLWVVDPLDGTKNFSRGIPHFAFTIALCHAGEPEVGLTLQPLLADEFTAVRGEGAHLNGKPTRVSPVERLADAIVGIDLGYDEARGAGQLRIADRLWPGLEAIRVAGSAALGFAFVAAGWFDLFIHANLQPWDSAGGIRLVEEAGGRVIGPGGLAGTPWDSALLAGTPAVVEEFLAVAGDLFSRA